MVWKFDDKYTVEDETADGGIRLKDVPAVHQFADGALISFLRIILHIKTEFVLAKYRDHPNLKKRLDQNYMERFNEGYRVRLGYGLHVGWSIEGAIGSEFKIDASYLS